MVWLTKFLLPGAVLTAALLLAGCSGGPPSQTPSAGFKPAAGGCQATKAQMGKLVAQGVETDINAASSGRALSADAQGRVDRYNTLLESYLDSRCHV